MSLRSVQGGEPRVPRASSARVGSQVRPEVFGWHASLLGRAARIVGACRSCGAEVEWAFTENDKRVPLDPITTPPDSKANLVVTAARASDYGMTPVVSYIGRGAGQRISHFATCPNSAAHRVSRTTAPSR